MKPDPEKTVEISEGHTIEIGSATWDETKTSVRNRYSTQSGGFSPRSSSEIPLHDIEPIVCAVAKHDLLQPDDCWAIIDALQQSLRRRQFGQ